jgi:hypothetical protein
VGAVRVDEGEDQSSLLDIQGVVVRRRRRRGRVGVGIC